MDPTTPQPAVGPADSYQLDSDEYDSEDEHSDLDAEEYDRIVEEGALADGRLLASPADM